MRDRTEISDNTGSTIYNHSTVIQYQGAAPYQADPKAVAAALATFAELPTDRVPARGAAAPPGGLHGVAPANPEFVGREADLQSLAAAIKANRPTAIGPVATAAAGIGGIGKSQLANEFAHRYGGYFPGGVFWIPLGDGEQVASAIAGHGGPAGLDLRPDFGALPLDAQVALVSSALQSALPRLLIFDNCETEDLFQAWRPPAGNSRVLLTSRNTLWSVASGVSVQPIDILARPESIALLCRHRDDLDPDDGHVDGIAAALGDLPLALHLAGSYLREYRGEDYATAPAYLAEITGPDTLEHASLTGTVDGQSPTDHDRHVGRTFLASLGRLDPGTPVDGLALRVLGRAAALAPGEAIPLELLRADTPGDAESNAGEAPSAQHAGRDALNRTLRLGLLTGDGESPVEMHRLVGHFVRANVDTAGGGPGCGDRGSHVPCR